MDFLFILSKSQSIVLEIDSNYCKITILHKHYIPSRQIINKNTIFCYHFYSKLSYVVLYYYFTYYAEINYFTGNKY